jgi:hypothetical protein
MQVFKIKVLMSYYNRNMNFLSGLPVCRFEGTLIKNHALKYGMLFLFSCLQSYHSPVIRHVNELCDKSE